MYVHLGQIQDVTIKRYNCITSEKPLNVNLCQKKHLHSAFVLTQRPRRLLRANLQSLGVVKSNCTKVIIVAK